MCASPSQPRRQFLGQAGAAVAAALLPQATFSAEKKSSTVVPSVAANPRNPFTYHFRIGDCDAWSISDGHMLFREGLNLMWPDTARDAMRADLVAHSERTDALPLYVNILVVKLGTEIAIFDAGFGRGRNPDTGWLADALAAIAIEPDKITQAFLSH